MNRKPKVWVFTSRNDARLEDENFARNVIDDDVYFCERNRFAKFVSCNYWGEDIILDRTRALSLDDPLEYFSEIIDGCKKHGIGLSMNLKICKSVAKKYPFLDESWLSVDVSFQQQKDTMQVTFFDRVFPPRSVRSRTFIIDDNIARSLWDNYWDALENTTSFCIISDSPFVRNFSPSVMQLVECFDINSDRDVVIDTFPVCVAKLHTINVFECPKSRTSLVLNLTKPFHGSAFFSHREGTMTIIAKTVCKVEVKTVVEKQGPVAKLRHKLLVQLISIMYNCIDIKYDLLEILNWLPFICQLDARYKENLVFSVTASIDKIRENRLSVKKVKI